MTVFLIYWLAAGFIVLVLPEQKEINAGSILSMFLLGGIYLPVRIIANLMGVKS